MRSSTKKKVNVGLSALAAASLGTWLSGRASAAADFSIQWVNNGLNVGGDDVWVLEATNTNPSVIGSGFAAADVTVSTPGSGTAGAIFMNIQSSKSVSHGVTSTTTNVNTTGATATTGSQPAFGNVYGSFVGWDTTYDGSYNPIAPTATDSTPADLDWPGESPSSFSPIISSTGVASIYVNSQTYPNNTSLVSGMSTHVSGTAAVVSSTSSASPVDPAFTSGTVHSLEVVSTSSVPNATYPYPIANVVVPTGTPITALVQIGGNASGAPADVYTVTTPGTTPPPSSVAISLTSTPVYSVAATVTVTGSQAVGYTPALATIPSAEAQTGSLVVNGFLPGDQEIYALDVLAHGAQATGATLAAIIAELQGVATGATVSAITDPRIQGLFPNADVEVTGTTGGVLNYDLSEDTTNSPTVASIGVVPEPTGVGLLIVGGLGLLARRRRSMQA